MLEEQFDGLIGVAKVVFVEFFDVLFFNTIDDALYFDGSDFRRVFISS